MILYAFRNRLWIVAAIIVADLLIAVFVGDKLIRWELEQIRAAW